jgi:hypothetical protein
MNSSFEGAQQAGTSPAFPAARISGVALEKIAADLENYQRETKALKAANARLAEEKLAMELDLSLKILNHLGTIAEFRGKFAALEEQIASLRREHYALSYRVPV